MFLHLNIGSMIMGRGGGGVYALTPLSHKMSPVQRVNVAKATVIRLQLYCPFIPE